MSQPHRNASSALLLQASDIHVRFDVEGEVHHAVRGVSIEIAEGQTVGLVGESGCGKTVSMLALVGLLPSNAEVSGRITYRGNLIKSYAELVALRGSTIGMVFQDSMSTLNPLLKVGVQVGEAVRRHRRLDRKAAKREAIRYLEQVSLPEPDDVYHAYPHELSGGERQRVMIAGALACEPELLIADEATTGLDVTTQAEILDLLSALRASRGLAVVFVSHDVGAVSELCDDLYVIYGGRAVEAGRTSEILNEPRHPYTSALLDALPGMEVRDRLTGIPGLPPLPHAFPPGCAFAPRCAKAMEDQCSEPPPLFTVKSGRRVECWLESAVTGD